MLIIRLQNRPQKPAWNAAAKRHVVPAEQTWSERKIVYLV